jgi:small redox-active disulfide protein 2
VKKGKTKMKDIKVLGPGCARCQTTADMVKASADRLGIEVAVEKVTDYAAIAGYGIAATPGIVIDGVVVHAGGLPKAEDLDLWLAGTGSGRTA